ncbi:MAG: TRAP transporter substrate-binding protein [Brachymonas sp.]|nr:TRAP transporter substrate-binding protein [Brachymonas sp.]
MNRTIFVSVTIFFIALCAAWMPAKAQNTAQKQNITLKFNHTDTPSGTRHLAAELFAQRVAQLSNGRIKVMVFHSGQLGNDPQSIKLVSEGKLDFTVSATGSYASFVPQLNLTALPYLVGSYEEGWRFYDQSPWLKEQFDKLPAKGLRHLATWEAGFRSFTTKSPLSSPADAQGKKMRVFPNEMIQWIVQAVGYEPVVIPVTEVYSAIQQGRVDGQENPIDTIRALRFYEVAPNIALTQHVYSPLPVVVSEQSWAKLSKADQQLIDKAADESQAFSRTTVRQQDERNLQQMQAAGAKITRPDAAAFSNAMKPVYEKARAKYGTDVDAVLKDSELSRSSAKR